MESSEAGSHGMCVSTRMITISDDMHCLRYRLEYYIKTLHVETEVLWCELQHQMDRVDCGYNTCSAWRSMVHLVGSRCVVNAAVVGKERRNHCSLSLRSDSKLRSNGHAIKRNEGSHIVDKHRRVLKRSSATGGAQVSSGTRLQRKFGGPEAQ